MCTSNICVLSFYIFISKSYSQNKNVKITQYRFWLHFCKIKCLRRRTVLIQTALCSPYLEEYWHTQNSPHSYQKFSRGLKKIFLLKTWGFFRIFQYLILTFIFWKSQLFSLFLTYNMIGLSCACNFLLEQRTRRQIFQIPRTCSQSPQKDF